MNSSLFSQAVDEAFPQLDEETRNEIKNKVTLHILEFLKDKAFEQDPQGLQNLNSAVEAEQDETKRSELYVKQITEKFSSLPEEERKKIDQELEKELTRVMHEIYKIYE